jgi:hypothetical protein
VSVETCTRRPACCWRPTAASTSISEESYQPLQNDRATCLAMSTRHFFNCVLRPATRSGSGQSVRSSAVAPRRCPGTASAPLPTGWSYLLGLHRGWLPAECRLQRPGLPGGPGRGGRRLRAGAGQRVPIRSPIRERPARRLPRADPRLPSPAGGAQRPAIRLPGLVAGGPIAAPEPGDVAVPQVRPIPIWGYWDGPAMPRDSSTPLVLLSHKIQNQVYEVDSRLKMS